MTELRDITTLRLHPDSERVPMAAADDLARLRASLEENGQQDPIHVTGDVILDGRTRWKLLGELGTTTIQVQDVAVPDDQQTNYIVDRALSRRHLTAAQKRVLNDLLRVQIIEERPTKRGNVMRIGHSQTERAATLGVDVRTVTNWDHESSKEDFPNQPSPTHAIDKRGRPQPIHKAERSESQSRSASDRPPPLRKSRPIPAWSRHFSKWCRGARPEDREFLRRLDREVHAALERNGIPCQKEGAA